ncbi:hypothetical protein ACLOJK_010061 [Asimina triloba]
MRKRDRKGEVDDACQGQSVKTTCLLVLLLLQSRTVSREVRERHQLRASDRGLEMGMGVGSSEVRQTGVDAGEVEGLRSGGNGAACVASPHPYNYRGRWNREYPHQCHIIDTVFFFFFSYKDDARKYENVKSWEDCWQRATTEVAREEEKGEENQEGEGDGNYIADAEIIAIVGLGHASFISDPLLPTPPPGQAPTNHY